jgi:endonuclease/exonuclease/phosphatase family metal-dependent hydrolase
MTPAKTRRLASAFRYAFTVNRARIVGFTLVVAALSSARPMLGAPLRVLTYNIHHSEGLDSVFDLQRIADVIIAANPDVVALQELDQGNLRSGASVFQLDDLAALTGMQGYFGPTILVPPENGGGEFGNGVLISPNITITDTANHPLPNPAAGEPRAVIEVGLSFDDAGSTVEFALFATHFDNTAEANRLAQATFVNDLVAASTTPALLAGDLNATPGSAPMQIIDDQWTRTSSHTSGIDYVLYRAADQWDVIEAGQFIVNPTTAVASDHLPLLTVVSVVPEPTGFLLAAIAVLTTGMFRYATPRLREIC